MGCKPCIEYGGVWCPKGHVVVWINGVRWTNQIFVDIIYHGGGGGGGFCVGGGGGGGFCVGGEESRGRICRCQQSVKGEP